MARRRRQPQRRQSQAQTAKRAAVKKVRYSANHKALREQWKKVVEAGGARCTRCGTAIHPGARWHLDHSDDASHYLGAAHASCNISAAQRRRHGLPTFGLPPPGSRTPPSRKRALRVFDTVSDQQEPRPRPRALEVFGAGTDAESSTAPIDLDAE